MLDARLQEETRVSRGLNGLVRVDIGLIVASIAVLAVGFALALAGADPFRSGSIEPQDEPTEAGAIHPKSSNLVVSIGPQIREGSDAEPFAADAPCATFDERFYYDRQLSTFDDRFASAFGSSGDAAGNAANAAEHANDMRLQQLDFGERATGKPATTQSALTPAPASRRASVRDERLNTAEATISLSSPLDADSRTAIYDIAARTVYLPNGQRLEAHSGLGSHLDDPRFVNAKGQGPTPPNVYNLTLRERLFHGVRAIRLNPVEDGKMFGRDGMLAHTYMLGPSGQSNGCVSFRNYPAFLNAYLKGEVDRLVVVEHLATTTGAKTSAKTSSASGG